MNLFKLGFRKKENSIEANIPALGGLALAGAGTGVALRAGTLPFREKIELTPGSKRIAIVYPGGSSGSGHKVPSKALADAYRSKGYQVDFYDIHDYQNKIVKRFISQNYAKIVAQDPVKNMPSNTPYDFNPSRPPLWEEIAEVKKGNSPNRGILRSTVGRELWNTASGHSNFIKELKNKNYERVIAMHGTTADALKHVGVPVDIVTTDFIHDPFAWKTDSAGKYFVPNAHAKKRFEDVGIPSEKIVETGNLLVRKELKTPESLQVPSLISEIKSKKPKAHVVTVLGGGTGIQVDQISEQVSKYYNAKHPDAHVIAITGGNEDAANYLKNLKAQGHLNNLTVLGYQSDVINYMKHSDLVVTRPGGSSTAEALHLGVPVVTFNHADVAKDFDHIGSHEHGNVKILHNEGMSRHFRTEYSPKDTSKITNIHALNNVLDEVHTNYNTLKENALAASRKYIKLTPEELIISSVPGAQRSLKLRTIGKIGVGLGLAGAAAGSMMYLNARKQTDKPLLKIAEDSNITKNIIGGVAFSPFIAGAVASTIFPKLRGTHGRLLGALRGTKKLFIDAPLHLLSKGTKGQSLLEAIGVPKPKRINGELIDALIRLTPTEIARRSENTLKSKGTDIGSLTHEALREKSKQYDMRSTISMLAEKELKARTAGLSRLLGFSHFTPSQAQRFGYVESDIVAPSIQPYLRKYGPMSYYTSEKILAEKKLKDLGLHSLDEMDAYWLTAPSKGIRFFEKDLTISPEQSLEKAKQFYSKMSPEKIKEYDNIEKEFKFKYDNLLKDIARAKDLNLTK